VLAPYGSGKSSLLRYSRNLIGGAAHPVQRTYSKAYLEQHFSGTAGAFFLDETESDTESDRIRRIIELVRLLSDDGAEGGRGSSSGKSRRLDVHGTVTMAATVTEEWPPQDRSRITLLELLPFADRPRDHPPAPAEEIAAMFQAASDMSAALRARALATWGLFQCNLRIARAAVLGMGGSPRDADQLGHLIAGWKTMTSDDELGDTDQLERFRPFIMSLVENEDGDDAPNDLLNVVRARLGRRSASSPLAAPISWPFWYDAPFHGECGTDPPVIGSSSDLRHPAVDEELDARDEAALIRGEE
jgi:hypothetical protein